MPLFAIPFPAVDPVLIELGPFAIRWYALSYIAGILIGWWYAKRLAGNAALWGPAGSPVKPLDIDDFVVWATAGIILGGRIGYVLFYNLDRFLENPLEIIAVWHGGMSFHGGFLGVLLASFLFARRRSIPFWSLMDTIAPAVCFGLFFGRLANFVNGELWGRAADVPWAVVFCNEHILAANDGTCPAGEIARHPSQLYEAGLEGIVLFLVLRFFTHSQKRLAERGFISGVFALGYGLARIVSEFFREPDVQIGFLAGGLTMGMLLSIPMVLVGIALILWSRRNRPATLKPAA